MHVPHLFDDRAYVKFDFHVSKIRAGLSKYVETPLFIDDKERAWHYRVKRHEVKNDSSLPLFKITSIEFGDNEPRFDQKKLDAMRNDLADYLVAKFGYKIEVKEKLFETGIGK